MKRLVIIATGFKNSPEAWKVFEQRKWHPVRDESTIPPKKKLVNQKKHNTPLIDLSWEEWEYDR